MGYITYQSRKVLRDKFDYFNQRIEGTLNDLKQLEKIEANLSDLSKISEKLGGAESIKDKIEELSNNITKLGSLDDIKLQLKKISKKVISPLNELNGHLDSIADNLAHLKEIQNSLGELHTLQNVVGSAGEIIDNLRNEIGQEIASSRETIATLNDNFLKTRDDLLCPMCSKLQCGIYIITKSPESIIEENV